MPNYNLLAEEYNNYLHKELYHQKNRSEQLPYQSEIQKAFQKMLKAFVLNPDTLRKKPQLFIDKLNKMRTEGIQGVKRRIRINLIQIIENRDPEVAKLITNKEYDTGYDPILGIETVDSNIQLAQSILTDYQNIKTNIENIPANNLAIEKIEKIIFCFESFLAEIQLQEGRNFLEEKITLDKKPFLKTFLSELKTNLLNLSKILPKLEEKARTNARELVEHLEDQIAQFTTDE